MRRTLIDKGARKALAVLASAALVAGLVPAAAFGEVGGGLPSLMRHRMLALLSSGLRQAKAPAMSLARGATPRARAAFSVRGRAMLLRRETKTALQVEAMPPMAATMRATPALRMPVTLRTRILTTPRAMTLTPVPPRAAAQAPPIPATPQAPPNPRRPKHSPMSSLAHGTSRACSSASRKRS